jgi:hypothetical protein
MTDPRNRTGTAGVALYLIALGIVAVAVSTLFGGAAFSLLTGNKAPTKVSIGNSAIERKEPELAFPVSNDTALIRADAEPPGSAPTNPKAQNPPRSDRSEDTQAKPNLAAAPDTREVKAPIPEDTSGSKNGDEPAAERPAEQSATTGVLVAGALGAAAVSAGSPTQVAPTFEEKRERLFHDFQIEHFLDQATMNRTRTTPAQPQNPHSSDGPTRTNAVFRYRMRRECGPIGDPALYRDCIASFRTHYR